jgi:hypothetical protein
MVEPKLAVPDNVGSMIAVGGWLVTKVETDQIFVLPDTFVLVVRAVRKCPASSATWV